ncbi:MAG: DUF5615 family PIN-like protein [Chloroflexota bacterium]
MPERIRFYLDEHVHKAVADGLRRRGVDVLRSQEAGMMAASDRQHLELALREGRVIFTQDADFLRLHTLGSDHAGIVYMPQHSPVGQMVRQLMLVYDLMDAEEMRNHIEFL